MNRKYIIPFLIIDLNHKQVPDQSDEHHQSGCEIECIVNLDRILEFGESAVIEKRFFDKELIIKSDTILYDIGCLHVEHTSDYELNDNSSIRLQVFYSKEIYDMFIQIILDAYKETSIYSTLLQRHRDDQIRKLL